MSLQVFNFSEGLTVRIIDSDGQAWFVAADVCKALDLTNTTKALDRLDDDEQALTSIQGITRGNDQVNIINESGLYSLILSSRKPEAKKFKKWVTSEVLPNIRKTGSYQAKSSNLPQLTEPNRPALTDQSTRYYLCAYQGGILQSQTLLTETALVHHLREQYPALEVVEKEAMVGNMYRLINELSSFAGQFTTYTESCARFDRLMRA